MTIAARLTRCEFCGRLHEPHCPRFWDRYRVVEETDRAEHYREQTRQALVRRLERTGGDAL